MQSFTNLASAHIQLMFSVCSASYIDARTCRHVLPSMIAQFWPKKLEKPGFELLKSTETCLGNRFYGMREDIFA